MKQSENPPLFYFATSDRTYILGKHNFYVSEARKRIFAQFSESNFEVEARQKEQDYYDEAGRRFNPDYDDEGSIVELAHDEGISHWLALDEMKNTVSLALTAGMFHQFDKELRRKCIMEFSHWLDPKIIAPMIWHTTLPRLIEMLESIGMDIIKKAYYKKIDICRQVVNVYKHGDGYAHKTLSTVHPEYYGNSSILKGSLFGLNYEQLEVTEAQFIEFANAIAAFWNDIPIYCMKFDMGIEPKWVSDVKKNKSKLV